MLNRLLGWSIDLMERGRIPDPLVRFGIRRLCGRRLEEEGPGDCESRRQALQSFIRRMDEGPIAPRPQKANDQHYELPPEFFGLVLGPHRKYSCCHWSPDTLSLGEAEQESLVITARRADLADGQEILELGCGWGSLTLWMAEQYPTARITAVSNSAPQRHYIEAEATRRGLGNVQVITTDINDFTTERRFDRVVSVEMFEHMRNYRRLLNRVAGWLKPTGKLFIHIFCHRELAYRFHTDGADDWLGRYFFTEGIMPSDDLLHHFQEDLVLRDQWRWSGRHYQATAEAWLRRLDENRQQVLSIFEGIYGPDQAVRWLNRWRVFFLACAELWGYEQGEEWWVSHYLFEPRPTNSVDRHVTAEEMSLCAPA
ncbi:MAG: cyclopropane-fatty-acyl-phospholipid synthase family protein [Phycisphaerae bacterium]|nr:cyclopropane-fatty-acyl-phospholipid synthase family protein [Phycisphaerae bacterium]